MEQLPHTTSDTDSNELETWVNCEDLCDCDDCSGHEKEDEL